jgi:hypothetical protein
LPRNKAANHQEFIPMTNDRNAFQKVSHAIGKRAAMRSILAAAVILSASTAVVHAQELRKYAEIQPGHGSMRAPVGHRQPSQGDVASARQAKSDRKIIEQDNELLDLPPSQSHVAGADEVPPDESALTKMIDEENARIDRLIKGICRGC